MSILVVTGTDTGVGKTVVTAALACRATARGERVAVLKPAQTGVGPTDPGDAKEIRRLSGVQAVHELARYPDPLAPATAAARAGTPGLTLQTILAKAAQLAADHDRLLIEGAGGLLVRLNQDNTTIADVAQALDAPVLVVVRAGLGTLNHAALTCNELARRGLQCAGLIIGTWPANPDLAAQTNREDLPRYTGQPVVGSVPAGAAQLDPAAFAAAVNRWIDPEAPF